MARVSLRRADRVSAILDRLAAEHSLNAADLAEEFGVSAATLRRDLQMLEDQKLLSRTHGGALAHDVAYELPVRYRGGRQRDEKRAIAARAAEHGWHRIVVVIVVDGEGGGVGQIDGGRKIREGAEERSAFC